MHWIGRRQVVLRSLRGSRLSDSESHVAPSDPQTLGRVTLLYCPPMLARLKPFAWPLLIAAFAATIYVVRIQKEMVDFEVYRQAAGRAMHAENLYRPDDGHYQYKYLPAFAFAMVPFAIVRDQSARLGWYALSFGLLCMFLRWSAVTVPERRLTTGLLAGLAIVFVGRFYGRELNLGQTNVLLGTTARGGPARRRGRRQAPGGGARGHRCVREAVRVDSRAVGLAGRRHPRADRGCRCARGRPVAAGFGVRLAGQPRSDLGLVSHRDGHERAEPALQGEYFVRHRVGQVDRRGAAGGAARDRDERGGARPRRRHHGAAPAGPRTGLSGIRRVDAADPAALASGLGLRAAHRHARGADRSSIAGAKRPSPGARSRRSRWWAWDSRSSICWGGRSTMPRCASACSASARSRWWRAWRIFGCAGWPRSNWGTSANWGTTRTGE